jgi:anti-sigma-K factor RskA
MMTSPCEKIRTYLLPGYVLNALDPVEQAEAEAHLAACADCRQEVKQMSETVHMVFGQTVTLTAPSSLVRTQFLARLALEMPATQAATIPAPPAVPLPPPRQSQQFSPGTPPPGVRPFIPRWIFGAIAAPALAVVALVALLLSMQNQLTDERNHLLSQAFAAPHVAMVLSGPASKHGMSGEVIMPKTGSAGLVIVSGMHSLPAHMALTCWLHMNGHWLQGGALQANASGIGMVVLDKNMDLHKADHVAISMEHTGQSPTAPSSPMLLSTTL